MPSYRSVALGIWVSAVLFMSAITRGISHFIEHMLFKGTKNRTAEQIAVEMDMLGGNLNALRLRNAPAFMLVLDKHSDSRGYFKRYLHNPKR